MDTIPTVTLEATADLPSEPRKRYRHALSDAAIRKAKQRAKSYKLTDGDGLYLLVQPNGAKWWRFDYRLKLAGTRKTISFGVYPDVTLATAREKRLEARQQVAGGHDPSRLRQDLRHAARAATLNTFGAVAAEWRAKRKQKLAPATWKKHGWILQALLLPDLEREPLATLDAAIILRVLRRIEAKGTHELAHRGRQICSQVCRYAVASGLLRRDPTADLAGALAPVVVTHRAAVTAPAAIGALLRALEAFDGTFVVKSALRLAPLVFLRPGELCTAEWDDIDLDDALWRIPAKRMKMREPHLVPLSRQAIAILKAIAPLTGATRFVFPSARTRKRPMTIEALTAGLRRLGFSGEEMTAHGFRTTASTRLNEMGHRPDLIERQLAHVEPNAVRAAYNRALYLEERRAMMQGWADELDRLRTIAP